MVEDTPTTPGWGKREVWGPPDRPSPSRGTSSKGARAGGEQCWGYPFAAGLLRNNKSFGGMSFTRLFKMRFLDVCGIQLFVWAPPTDNGELAFLGLTPWSL